jgi:hypothetical protein
MTARPVPLSRPSRIVVSEDVWVTPEERTNGKRGVDEARKILRQAKERA